MDGEAYFREHGYYPTTFVPSKPKQQVQRVISTNQQRFRRGFPAGLALRGWRAPMHWSVPPAFEKPGLVYQLLGHEEYCRQVEGYYAAIRDRNVEQAKSAHARWAVRACLRTFETHVRGFRKQDVGSRGGIFSVASAELTMPEDLIADGRIMYDLRAYLRAYGVPEKQHSAAERLFRSKLSQMWGVKC